MHDTFFIASIEQYSYLAIFIFALFSGYFIPIPEEIILLITGYMARSHLIHLTPAIFVVVVAFIIGDNILFKLTLLNQTVRIYYVLYQRNYDIIFIFIFMV